jgi:hypothetical protein
MSEIYELRQYTLHPGKRDTLIDLFEREFIETQEAAGMRVVAQFRDLGDPDRFVWFRSFPDMVRRKEALTSFYSDETWRTHRNAANATMIDSDNVLLLRLADPHFGFPTSSARPPIGAIERPSTRYTATVYSFDRPIEREHIDAVLGVVTPITLLQTEPSENTYPALPVRAGENVIVTLTMGDSAIADDVLASSLKCPPQRLTLEPTARSLLR